MSKKNTSNQQKYNTSATFKDIFNELTPDRLTQIENRVDHYLKAKSKAQRTLASDLNLLAQFTRGAISIFYNLAQEENDGKENDQQEVE